MRDTTIQTLDYAEAQKIQANMQKIIKEILPGLSLAEQQHKVLQYFSQFLGIEIQNVQDTNVSTQQAGIIILDSALYEQAGKTLKALSDDNVFKAIILAYHGLVLEKLTYESAFSKFDVKIQEMAANILIEIINNFKDLENKLGDQYYFLHAGDYTMEKYQQSKDSGKLSQFKFESIPSNFFNKIMIELYDCLGNEASSPVLNRIFSFDISKKHPEQSFYKLYNYLSNPNLLPDMLSAPRQNILAYGNSAPNLQESDLKFFQSLHKATMQTEYRDMLKFCLLSYCQASDKLLSRFQENIQDLMQRLGGESNRYSDSQVNLVLKDHLKVLILPSSNGKLLFPSADNKDRRTSRIRFFELLELFANQEKFGQLKTYAEFLKYNRAEILEKEYANTLSAEEKQSKSRSRIKRDEIDVIIPERFFDALFKQVYGRSRAEDQELCTALQDKHLAALDSERVAKQKAQDQDELQKYIFDNLAELKKANKDLAKANIRYNESEKKFLGTAQELTKLGKFIKNLANLEGKELLTYEKEGGKKNGKLCFAIADEFSLEKFKEQINKLSVTESKAPTADLELSVPQESTVQEEQQLVEQQVTETQPKEQQEIAKTNEREQTINSLGATLNAILKDMGSTSFQVAEMRDRLFDSADTLGTLIDSPYNLKPEIKELSNLQLEGWAKYIQARDASNTKSHPDL